MKVLTLYTKTNCPLCDKAKEQLKKLQREISFDIEEVDIYKDDQLLEKYQLMIPVIADGDREIDYGQISVEKVRKALRE